MHETLRSYNFGIGINMGVGKKLKSLQSEGQLFCTQKLTSVVSSLHSFTVCL